MHVLVCICSNVRQFQSMLWTNIGSVFVAWPCFVSQNLWIKYNDCGHLYLSLQAFALWLALNRPDLLIRGRVGRVVCGDWGDWGDLGGGGLVAPHAVLSQPATYAFGVRCTLMPGRSSRWG